MKQLKLALVGAGGQAKFGHLPVLKSDANCVLTVVIDPSTAARETIVKEIPSAYEYESLDAADLSGIDCAIVSSPTGFHYRQVKYLLERNIHVFCEKPLAQTGREAQELAELSRKRNLVLQAGFNRRFQPVTHYIIDCLKTDRFGRLNAVTVRAGSIAKDLPATVLNPAISGGGIVMDYAVHFIDRLCSWFEKLEVVSYEDDSRGGAEACALIRLNGATYWWKNVAITIMMSWANELGDTIRLDFENVTLTCTINNAAQLSIFNRNRNTPFLKRLYEHKVVQTSDKAIDIKMLQWKEFISRIKGGGENFSSLDDAVRTTAIVEECYARRKSLELSWGL
ncbi:MAG TPA: Gfo/Idh/MocA family oxidoreductase [Chitinophagales bacterium]|nr:Gfo/Idh/MocA family oxidoreductase [Chitinophagales bacterium]